MRKNDSPSKPQRILVEQESSATIAVSTPAFLSLAKRAGKSKYPLTVLEQVYCRGILNSKYHPKNTPEQQAFQRVDSFIHEGKAYELDRDLLEACPVVPDGKKHMHIIKNAIKKHEERNAPEPDPEAIKEDWATALGVGIGRLALSALGANKSKKHKTQRLQQIQRRQNTQNIDTLVQKKLQQRAQGREISRRVKEIEQKHGLTQGPERFEYKPTPFPANQRRKAYDILQHQYKDELSQRQSWKGKRLKADQKREAWLKSQVNSR